MLISYSNILGERSYHLFVGFKITALLAVLLLCGCGSKMPVSGGTDDGVGKMSNGKYLDKMIPSSDPPGGLKSSQVPQFVTIGFDDNGFSGAEGSGGIGGMTFALDMLKARKNHDGTPVLASFFMTTDYISPNNDDNPQLLRQTWRRAFDEGHEIGNHTRKHEHGDNFTVDEWGSEMTACNNDLTKSVEDGGIGIGQDKIVGFRTPFLGYNDATFEAVQSTGFLYDCTIEEGYQPDQDGTNYFWPYTLNEGSPGNVQSVKWEQKQLISNRPGLWELPVYAVIVPPDEECERYGVTPGLRVKMKKHQDYFEPESGKITGFDYNLWVLFKMTKAEFLATLKYSLDLRLKGNRAPFMLGGHTDMYSNKYPEEMPNASLQDRQEALEEFLDYALSKPEVKINSMDQILNWIRQTI